MIKASLLAKDLNPTVISDSKGKNITICSSRIESEYLSPRQLLQGAVAGCLSMTVRRVLDNHEVAYSDVTVLIDMPQENDTYKLVVDIQVDSADDLEKIEVCKQEALNTCFIKGLVESGMKIEEAELVDEEASVQYERCCE